MDNGDKKIIANQSKFDFSINNNPKEKFLITSFSSNKYCISNHYYYDIHLYSTTLLNIQKSLSQMAKLIFFENNAKYYIHGVIADIKDLSSTMQSQYYYKVTLSSPLHLLSLEQRSKVFVGKTISSILTEVLTKSYKWNKLQWKLQDLSTKTYGMLIQYKETDLEFLSRLFSQFGLLYRFEQSNVVARLIIFDPKQAKYPTAVHRHLECIEAKGMSDMITPCIMNWTKSHKLTKEYAVITATTTAKGLILGQRIMLQDRRHQALKGYYFITSIQHHYNSDHILSGYTNIITAIPIKNTYDLSLSNNVSRQLGIQPAKIESFNDLYKLRFAFDNSANISGKASSSTKMTQPMVGKKHGFHCPLIKNLSVVTIFQNNISPVPVIIGILPAVTGINDPVKHQLSTQGNNNIAINDHKDEQAISIYTNKQSNLIHLNYNKSLTTIYSQSGYIKLHASIDHNVTSNKSYSRISNKNSSTIIRNHKYLEIKNNNLHLNANDLLQLSSVDQIRVLANRNCNIQVATTISFCAEKHLSIKVNTSDFKAIAARNHIVKFNSNCLLTGKQLATVGFNSIVMRDAKTEFMASTVKLKAPEIIIYSNFEDNK